MGITDLWGQLIDCICRPPRDHYTVEQLIGGTSGKFRIGRFKGRRDDLTLTNKKGQSLVASHFVPEGAKGKDGRLPCVIYCHCNSGSRRDAEEAVHILLPLGVSVFTLDFATASPSFSLCLSLSLILSRRDSDEAVHVLLPLGVSVFTLDFAGSGLSDGDYVTLGANEVEDVEVAVNHLRSTGKISTLGLWGRSMGAVTALLYAQRDPSIAGLVVDSPFSRLTDLMLEIVAEQNLPIPRPLFKAAVAMMKRSVRKKAGFDLDTVSPLDVVPEAFIPVLFGHATGDSFIKISHSERLHEAYAGDKNLITFEGDHNSRRPEFFHSSVSVFFHNMLQLDTVLEGGNTLDAELRRAANGFEASAASASAAREQEDGVSEEELAQLASAHSGGAAQAIDQWGARARGTLTQQAHDGTAPHPHSSDSADLTSRTSSESRRLEGGQRRAVVDAADNELGGWEDEDDDVDAAALMAAIQASLLESAAAASSGRAAAPGQEGAACGADTAGDGGSSGSTVTAAAAGAAVPVSASAAPAPLSGTVPPQGAAAAASAPATTTTAAATSTPAAAAGLGPGPAPRAGAGEGGAGAAGLTGGDARRSTVEQPSTPLMRPPPAGGHEQPAAGHGPLGQHAHAAAAARAPYLAPAAPAQQQQQAHVRRHAHAHAQPDSAETEAAMLRAAIELSLAESLAPRAAGAPAAAAAAAPAAAAPAHAAAAEAAAPAAGATAASAAAAPPAAPAATAAAASAAAVDAGSPAAGWEGFS
ncbi:hypothetical protein FOA52_010971 [Chlamydomonas sp. UWO 241]|nr:hypothetical protein FOA52_010971 [Chlamydomonas sp. UWO 241]